MRGWGCLPFIRFTPGLSEEGCIVITKGEILQGRHKLAPLTRELEANLSKLWTAVNIVRSEYNKPMRVSSGYRPVFINARTPGAATNSAHITCQAVDFWDPDHELVRFLQARPELLERAGLWMEDPNSTPTWCHLQIRPVRGKSGSRVFLAEAGDELDQDYTGIV